MRITGIRLSHHRLALDPPFDASWDPRPRTDFHATIVRVETDQGLTGIGSGDSMPGFAGHEALFIGRDPRDMERHWRVIDSLSLHYGRCWPLDIALWDLAGQIEGVPCWRMLGGLADRVPAYASLGGRHEKAAALERTRRLVARGFKAVKLRFQARHWRDDVAVMEAVRAALGDRVELMVDCNQGWRMPWDTAPSWTFDQALEVVRALEPLNPRWIEEPLHRGDYAGLAALGRATRIPIAGGEMTRELHELDWLVEGECLDVLQPDAVLVGGLTGLVRIARLARARKLTFSPHSWGNGIGLLANAHLAAGCAGSPYLEYPFDPPEWTPARRDFMLAEPVEVDADGMLVLSDAPGLGLRLDEKRLEATKL